MSTKVAKNSHSRGRQGGREKGTPNKDTQHIMDLCRKLDCDPVEIMVHIAKGDWKALGYDTGEIQKVSFGVPTYEDRIQLSDRLDASKTLMGFIYPKRKAIEIKDDSGNTVKPIVLAYNQEALEKASNGKKENT
jgi:hypothetical protein